MFGIKKQEKTKLVSSKFIAGSERGLFYFELIKCGDLYSILSKRRNGVNYNSYNLGRAQSYFLFLKVTVEMMAIDRFVTRTGEIDVDGEIIPVNQIEVFFGDRTTTVINVYKNEHGLFEMAVKLLDCILNNIEFKVFTNNGVEIMNKYKRGEVVLDYNN